MKFEVTQDGLTYRVEARVRGRFRPATRHDPAEAPAVDLADVTPDIPSFDAGRAREQIIDELKRRSRR